MSFTIGLVLFRRMRYLRVVRAIETRYCFTALKKTPASTGQPRRRSRRILKSVFLLAGCVLVIDALVGDKGLLAMIQARQEFRNLEQSLADVRAENARLRDEARRLREDPSAVEDLARRELGLIKPGEKLFIIRDVAPKDPQ
jgi:cell division protein FtsB